MKYAKIQGLNVLKYPYTMDDLRADNPSTGYGDLTNPAAVFADTDPAKKNGWQLVVVQPTAQPAFNPLLQTVSEAVPLLQSGSWVQSWVVSNLPISQAQANMEQACLNAVQDQLDFVARSWQYLSILSATTYAASTVPKFKAEALALIAWRDAVWVYAYTTLASIQDGSLPMPSSTADFIATLPAAPTRPVA
jgi:hypothetical protein